MYCSSHTPVQWRTIDRPCTRHKQTFGNGPKSMCQVSLQLSYARMTKSAYDILLPLFERQCVVLQVLQMCSGCGKQRQKQHSTTFLRYRSSRLTCIFACCKGCSSTEQTFDTVVWYAGGASSKGSS